MGYTIFRADELDWQHPREGDPRLVATLSDAMTHARATLFRYPSGAPPVRGETVFLDAVLD